MASSGRPARNRSADGGNGCGKSTLGKILQKRYQVEKGEILVNSHIPLDNISLSSQRKKIAVVEQQLHIFNGNVRENIAFEDVDNNLQLLKRPGILTPRFHTTRIYYLR